MSTVDDLAEEFWAWRAQQQPRTPDDLPRIGRPPGWLPRVSAADMAAALTDLARFEARLAGADIDVDTDSGADAVIADDIDRRLLGSAIARVRWETEVLQLWRRQPSFYVDQSLGCVFDLLTQIDPDADRLREVTRFLQATPGILETGKENLLDSAVAEFAARTIDELDGVAAAVDSTTTALSALAPPGWTPDDSTALLGAGAAAGAAVESFRGWLIDRLSTFQPVEPVGAQAFQWFLNEVALLPYSPEELLRIGSVEAERASWLETTERLRNGTTGPRSAPPPSFATWQEQSAAERIAEQEVRDFYEERDLLTQPDSLRHYHTTVLPEYLAPLIWLGVPDDLTGPDRLDSNGSAFFPAPAGDLPYFYAANANDPRAGIIHEGVHYQQLCLSWRHPRPVRRHYYDSTSNEGIAFYNEELMLASGMFDDAPRTREIIYNFMRLRALRVVVDVGLATGELDIAAAGDILEKSVPMDRATARQEAAFFAATPGQAMTYQIGKVQILRLMADAAAAQGSEFSLRAFHDRLWLEGNVPIALQRWELLEDRSDLDRINAARVAYPAG